MKKLIMFAAVAGLVLALAPAAQATLTGPGGIICPTGTNPDTASEWAVGDKYHLVFATSTKTNATSTVIGDYDAFVQARADAAGIGSGVGVSWVVMGATAASGNAKDHAVVTAPVYLVDGSKVADGVSIWDTIPDVSTPPPDTLYHPIDIDENGVQVAVEYYSAWTGTGCNGAGLPGWGAGETALGGAQPVAGRTHLVDGNWAQAWWQSSSSEYRLYGLSGELTVIPEPATMALLAFGGLGVLLRRRRR